MPYLGRYVNTDKTTKTYKLDTLAASFTGACTIFSLTSSGMTVYPPSARNLLISINGVVQEPDVAFTVSGATITFTGAPAAGAAFFGVVNSEPYDPYVNPSVASLNVVGLSTLAAATLSGNLTVGASKFTVAAATGAVTSSGDFTSKAAAAVRHGLVLSVTGGDGQAGMDVYGNTGEVRIGGFGAADYFPVIYSDGVAALTFGIGAAPSATFVGAVTSSGDIGSNVSSGTPALYLSNAAGGGGLKTSLDYAVATGLTRLRALGAPGSGNIFSLRTSVGGTEQDTVTINYLGNTTLSGLLTVSGFGIHTFSAGSNGLQELLVENSRTTNVSRSIIRAKGGDGAASYGALGAEAGGITGYLQVFPPGYTTSGPYIASGIAVHTDSSGGLSIAATSASGDVRVYTRGTTLRATFNGDGLLLSGGNALQITSLGSDAGTALIITASGYVYKTTSSERYKEHFSPFMVTPDALAAFVALTPKNWDYIGKQDGAVSFTSEQLAELPILNAYGRNPLVNYDAQGRPESNRDYGIIALQHLVLQSHDTRLAALEAEIAELKRAA